MSGGVRGKYAAAYERGTNLARRKTEKETRATTPARLNPFAASRVEALDFRFPAGWGPRFPRRPRRPGGPRQDHAARAARGAPRVARFGPPASDASPRPAPAPCARPSATAAGARSAGRAADRRCPGARPVGLVATSASQPAGGGPRDHQPPGGAPPHPAALRDLAGLDLPGLYRRHGGNVREALWELYDRWAAGGGFSPPARSATP